MAKFCKHCGSPMKHENSKFCTKCGKATVAEPAAAPAPSPTTAPTAPPPTVPPAPAAPSPAAVPAPPTVAADDAFTFTTEPGAATTVTPVAVQTPPPSPAPAITPAPAPPAFQAPPPPAAPVPGAPASSATPPAPQGNQVVFDADMIIQPVEPAIPPPPPAAPPATAYPVFVPPEAPPPQKGPAPTADDKKKKGGKGKIVVIVAAVLVLALVGLFFGLRATLNQDPYERIEQFVNAVAIGDTETLLDMTDAPGLTLDTDALAPLVRAGQRADFPAQLRDELTASWEAGGNDRGSFTLVEQEQLLFFRSYSVELAASSLTISSPMEEMSVTLDGQALSSTLDTAAGETAYRADNLVPGLYSVQAAYNKYGISLTSSLDDVLVTTIDNLYIPEFNAATVAVACEYDDAAIFINGQPSSLRVNGGYLSLYPAVQGMEVTAVVQSQDGPLSATIRLDDLQAQFTFSFSAAEEELDEQSLMEIDVIYTMLEYYQYYLMAINEQDASWLAACTDKQLDVATERISSEANRDLLFNFMELWIDWDTFEFYEEGGTQKARVLVSLRFEYTSRNAAGDWESGGNIQWCTLVLDDGQWLVDESDLNNDETLSDNLVIYG